jgi:hypothetical protein
MSESPQPKHTGFLLLLGIALVVLIFLLSRSFRADNIVAGPFQIEEIQICEELDDAMRPIQIHEGRFPGGTKQVCLWFRYSKARTGDMLEIQWEREDYLIQRETMRVTASEATRAFYLMKEDGQELPGGYYRVLLFCNGREKAVERFTIATAASGDIMPGVRSPDEEPAEETGGI